MGLPGAENGPATLAQDIPSPVREILPEADRREQAIRGLGVFGGWIVRVRGDYGARLLTSRSRKARAVMSSSVLPRSLPSGATRRIAGRVSAAYFFLIAPSAGSSSSRVRSTLSKVNACISAATPGSEKTLSSNSLHGRHQL